MANQQALTYFQENDMEVIATPRDSRNKFIYTVRYNCGHVFTGSLQYLKRRKRCTECLPAKNSPKSYEKIQEIVASKGYELNGVEKKGGLIVVDVSCLEDHKWKVYFSNFQKEGRNCPYCAREEVNDLFFYLQKVSNECTGLTYCKYGITKNWPDLRVNKQAASSGMKHQLTDFAWLRKDVVVELESFLKKTISHVDLGYKFDGYTETVSSEHEDFLRMFIVNAVSYDGNMEEYLERISSRCG